MVGADFVSLVSSHDQPDLLGLFVLQQFDVTSTTFLPLTSIPVKFEELRSPKYSCKIRIRLDVKEMDVLTS